MAAGLPGPALRFDANSYAGGREKHLAPPRLGQHNDSVREWLDEMDRHSARSEDGGSQQ